MMKRVGWLLGALPVFESAAAAGMGGTTTKFVGGTLLIKLDTEGTSSITDENDFVFVYKGGKLAIPYLRITALEYGNRVGRQMGLASINPVGWFSRKRTNFLTVSYKDADGGQQAAVFELGRDIVKRTVSHLEARTGCKVKYDDEEARRSVRGTSREHQAGLSARGPSSLP